MILLILEPSLHPEFVSYPEKIKQEHFWKVFFTTNLAKEISDDKIERLSNLKIAFINISLAPIHLLYYINPLI